MTGIRGGDGQRRGTCSQQSRRTLAADADCGRHATAKATLLRRSLEHAQTPHPVTTPLSRLHTSLLAGWDRAVLTSLAEDLGHEFVALVLPLLPEAAPEFARLLAGHQGYNELWLLLEHAPLLWRHARAELVARLDAGVPMLNLVELLADIAREAPPHEREELRARAMAALSQEQNPRDRGRALLDWAPLEAPDRSAAMIAEALDIVRSASPAIAGAIVRGFADRFDTAQRAELRAVAQRPDAAAHGADLLFTLACVGPSDEALADARAALEQCARTRPNDIQYTICALLDVVPFDVLRPWVEAWLRTIDDRRGLCFAAHQLAPRAPPAILDHLVELADALDVEIWARAEILADVAGHHPTRGEELRLQVREAIEQVVGDATLGHRMAPEDVPQGADPIVLQAQAIARAGAVLGRDARELQRLVLSRIAEMPSDFDDRHDLDAITWDELGATLDPALRAEAVRTVLSLRHRPSALTALGRMAAQFPAEARHLALDGLSRLADATPPAAMERALQALSRARTDQAAPPATLPGKGHGRGGDTLSEWTGADERSLSALTQFLSSGAYLRPDPLRELAHALTPAAATRATALVLGMTSPYDRLKAVMALESAPRLGKREREELLTAALALIGTERFMSFDAPELSRAISEVCANGDATWADRVAGFFDAQRLERESYLALVEAFAPLLRRLGGPELITALTSKLRAPLPTPEFARPWALAARGTFDA